MAWTTRTWLGLAAASGFVSVLAGAFAAHGVNDPHARELLRTGSNYEAIHALATFAAAAAFAPGFRRAALAPALFLGGSVLFSGSLYGLALGVPRWLGAVTPVGGLMFLAGWAVMAWTGFSPARPETSDA